MLDWWLMERFPGRTLEELDSVDILRLFRAHEVGRIVDVERKRAAFLGERIKAEDIPDSEWKMITRHDRLMKLVDNGDSAQPA